MKLINILPLYSFFKKGPLCRYSFPEYKNMCFRKVYIRIYLFLLEQKIFTSAAVLNKK